MHLSVVIAAHNELENLRPLLDEVRASLGGFYDFEIVVVDDGSTDETPEALKTLRSEMPELRVLRHRHSCGQSTALMTGVAAATAPVIATLDGDGQNDPHDIPGMLDVLQRSRFGEQCSMVAGFRHRRRDSRWRLFCSKLANGVRRRILHDDTPDSGCGIKVFHRSAFLAMPHFNHMHRFLPALIVRSGGRVVSFPVNHRPRMHGRSHYDTLRRLFNGLIDLAGVAWLLHRNRIPELEKMDAQHDTGSSVDSIRIDGARPVHKPFPRAVA